MGRAYNSLVQETRIADDKNYAILKADLKRELIASMDRYLYYIAVYFWFVWSTGCAVLFVVRMCFRDIGMSKLM
jgi:predicted branched-subunit amino acid permease